MHEYIDIDLAKINPHLDRWVAHCENNRHPFRHEVTEIVSLLRESEGKIENTDRAIGLLNEVSFTLGRSESSYFRKVGLYQAHNCWSTIIKTEIDKAISNANTSSPCQPKATIYKTKASMGDKRHIYLTDEVVSELSVLFPNKDISRLNKELTKTQIEDFLSDISKEVRKGHNTTVRAALVAFNYVGQSALKRVGGDQTQKSTPTAPEHCGTTSSKTIYIVHNDDNVHIKVVKDLSDIPNDCEVRCSSDFSKEYRTVQKTDIQEVS